MKKTLLNQDEKEIIEAYNNGEFVQVENIDQEIERHADVARQTLLKSKNINLRLSESDLLDLKGKAVEAGIPYQTLAASVIHRYVKDKPLNNL